MQYSSPVVYCSNPIQFHSVYMQLLNELLKEDSFSCDLQNVLFHLLASLLLVSDTVTLVDAKKLLKYVSYYILHCLRMYVVHRLLFVVLQCYM